MISFSCQKANQLDTGLYTTFSNHNCSHLRLRPRPIALSNIPLLFITPSWKKDIDNGNTKALLFNSRSDWITSMLKWYPNLWSLTFNRHLGKTFEIRKSKQTTGKIFCDFLRVTALLVFVQESFLTCFTISGWYMNPSTTSRRQLGDSIVASVA